MDPSLFLSDLEARPDHLRRLAGILDAADPWAGIPADPRRVLLLGMGSSRYAGQVAARRLRAAGIDAVAEYASAEAGHPAAPGTLVVAVSAGGGSVETRDALARYPDAVVLTNMPGSATAGRAATVVEMHAGVEAGGVACRTFTHTLVLLLDLADRLAGRPRRAADLARRAADAAADLLDRRGDWLPRAADLLDGPHGVYALAPAERISSAMQAALMVREGPRRAATGCETGDWSHVDVYLAKTLEYRALLFPGSRYEAEALDWLRRRGSTVVAVGSEVDGAALCVRYPGDDDPAVRLLTEYAVAELVAATWWAAG